MGWMQFSDREKRYVVVHMVTGRGMREVSFPLQVTSAELIEAMTQVFLPDGTSGFGATDQMTFKLGNFRYKEIMQRKVHQHGLMSGPAWPKAGILKPICLLMKPNN